MAEFISEEEFLKLKEEQVGSVKPQGAQFISQEEFEELKSQSGGFSGSNQDASFLDYLRTVPATAVDITLGSGEGFASAIGSFTGNYNLARSVGAFRDDINDAIMGDVPDDLQSDFIYKLSSGLGSTIPFLGAAIISRNPSYLAKIGAGAFFLSSAGQQVRDDYLATQGVTSENASDEQMVESNKAGAIGAIPIALAERLGAGMILRPFARGAIPAGQVMERITQYASAGAGEALTEATQSGLINSIAGYVRQYDPDRPITQGMAESALIGFLVGGGVNATVDTVNRKITQSDRLKAGIANGDINAKDVIDPEVGSKLTEVAMENGGVPEADTEQQKRITDPQGWRNFVSKTLTPISQRLGRAGKEIVREFRNYERITGIKTKEYKKRVAEFQSALQKLKKASPKDYEILSQALANANELSESLPQSVKQNLEKKAQVQPEINRSESEQVLDKSNPNAQLINNQIDQARASLESRGMSTRIEISKSGSSYYDPSTNLIVISAEQADGTTVAHEFFHAILGQAVKTDVELQSMTRNMFDSVIRASVDGSSLNEQLKGFVSQYDTNIQNEEFLAQTVGELARQYQTLDINTKTRVKIWINQAMQLLGMQGAFKQAETDAEVIQQLNAFARFSGEPEALTENPSQTFKEGNEGAISAPIRATKFVLKDLKLAPLVQFSNKKTKTSNITKDDSFNIIEVINEAIKNDSKVVFWQSDQLGIGKYTSPLTKKKYDLDGGIGYAKSLIKGRKNFVWASTSEAAVRASAGADLVLMVSGNPKEMHFFNKVTPSIIYDNIIHKYKSIEAFTDRLMQGASADQKLAQKILSMHKEFPTKELLIGDQIRKEFGKNISNRAYTAAGIPADIKADLQQIAPNPSDIKDSHLVNNNFKTRDIYGAFIPNGKYSPTDSHGTYGLGIEGTFLGTPDRIINIEDMVTEEFMNRFAQEEQISTYERKLKKDPDIEMGKLPTRGEVLSGIAGRQAGYYEIQGKEFRATTEEEMGDAVDKSKPATAKQIAEGADAIRKKQLKRTPISIPKVKGTKAFRKWFGKGTLVHEDGEPMVLYHGTKEDITEFKGSNPNLKDWVFFSTDPELSAEMAMRKPLREGLEESVEKVDEGFSELNESEIADLAAEYYSRPHDPQDSLLPERLIARQEYERKRIGMDAVDYADLGGINVMPAYLNAKRIFDPRSDADIDYLMQSLENYRNDLVDQMEADNDFASGSDARAELEGVKSIIKEGREGLRSGFYGNYELEFVSDALKRGKYDGIILSEVDSARDPDLDNRYNLTTVAVWNGASGIKSATGNSGAFSSSPDIREQKDRNYTASEIEIARGLSDEGAAIMAKYGMTNSYKEVRSVLDQLKEEYRALGLDMNYIDNYFPRLMKDLEGFKASIGQTVGVDEEIRRYESMTGQKLTEIERQKMYEKLARSRMYRSGISQPANLKERRNRFVEKSELQYYADPASALNEYVDRMVNTIETKKLIGDAQSGKTQGVDAVAGKLGEVMEKMASEGRLRQDQIDVIQGAVAARFGQHGRQYGFVKGMKNAGYLATMGNTGSTLTQLGDFYFTMVQNGLLPTIQSAFGAKALTVEDLGIAKDLVTVETKDGQGFLGKSVDNVFKITGLTAMDRLAKNTNINAAYKVLTKGAKSKQGSRAYEKTLARLKRVQGNDAYKTIADLQSGTKSDFVIEALYNELADVAPISLTEMPENYASNPNLRILYSLKSYTIKQFNFVRERSFSKVMDGIRTNNPQMVADGSLQLMRILAFGALANGSADVLKAILFNREIDDEDFWWNHFLRMFGITKYTTVMARKEGVGDAIVKSVLPPQGGMLNDIFKDIASATDSEGNGLKINEMRTSKYLPVVGKLYYWREGRGVETEEKLSRLRGKD